MDIKQISGVAVDFDEFEEYLRAMYPDETRAYGLSLSGEIDGAVYVVYYEPEDYAGDYPYILSNSEDVILEVAEAVFKFKPSNFYKIDNTIYFLN